ncbi:hypothetical protein B9J78_01230 [bacterium Unc6]|nr:hypothetical protein [bacterium Unc6]
MAKLTVKSGPDEGIVFKIQEEITTIGRIETNKIIIHDEGVSKGHCVIEARKTGYFITDLGSTNGTYLNGKIVKTEAELYTEDQIKVGNTVLIFESKTEKRKTDLTNAFKEIEEEEQKGKGYTTLLQEFVETASIKSEEEGIVEIDPVLIKEIVPCKEGEIRLVFSNIINGTEIGNNVKFDRKTYLVVGIDKKQDNKGIVYRLKEI